MLEREPFLQSRDGKICGVTWLAGIYTNGVVLDAQNHRTSIGKDVLETVSKDVTKLIFNLGQQHRKHMM